MRARANGALMLGSVVEAIVPLCRNLVLARLMAPADVGLALSIALVLALVEVVTDIGLPMQAMRRPARVPLAQVLPTLHSLMLVRASVMALAFFSLAIPAARWLGAPHAAATFMTLAGVALLRGFENLGVKALMRSGRFEGEAVVLILSQLTLLAVTCTIAALTRSYTAVVWGVLAQTVIAVALSHILSPRPWRLGWRPQLARQCWEFGRPLLLNGAAVATATSDRLIVGSVLGPAALAIFGVAVGTATLPRMVLAKYLTSSLVPRFARELEQGAGRRLADAWAFSLSALALTYGLALLFLGGPALGLVFGPAYRPPPAFMAVLALALAIKILLLLPVPPAYARGDTRLIAVTSLSSAAGVVLAIPTLIQTRDPAWFLLIAAVVESVALAWIMRELPRRYSFSARPLRLLVVGPLIVLAVLGAVVSQSTLTPTQSAIALSCVLILMVPVLDYGRRRCGIQVHLAAWRSAPQITAPTRP